MREANHRTTKSLKEIQFSSPDERYPWLGLTLEIRIWQKPDWNKQNKTKKKKNNFIVTKPFKKWVVGLQASRYLVSNLDLTLFFSFIFFPNPQVPKILYLQTVKSLIPHQYSTILPVCKISLGLWFRLSFFLNPQTHLFFFLFFENIFWFGLVIPFVKRKKKLTFFNFNLSIFPIRFFFHVFSDFRKMITPTLQEYYNMHHKST